MIGSTGGLYVRISLPLKQSHHGRHHHHHHHHSPATLIKQFYTKKFQFQVVCKTGDVTLTKQASRFLTSLAVAGDASTTKRLIRKFISASSKSVALNALSHLLSPHASHSGLSYFALPLYSEITEASWFTWNQNLVADLIALLNKQEEHDESEFLLSQAITKLKSRERDLVLFYCNLMESNSKQGSDPGFERSYGYMSELLSTSSSVYVKRQAYKSMVSGLSEMGKPQEAETLVDEMKTIGIKPSMFEFRSVVYAYGKLKLFDDMQRLVSKMEIEGLKLDTICSNMILSSYGSYNALPEMVSWLQKMRDLRLPFSTRTYNTVLNSCSTIVSTLQELKCCPLSVVGLIDVLSEDEAGLVRQLVETSVLEEVMEWNELEGKLDLHGMHLTSAYLIMLQWMEEIHCRFSDGNLVVPGEVVVVCGSGKHSSVRGESPVKSLVKAMMIRSGSPMRIDRKNIGCFIAKGKAVKNWLSSLNLS